MEYELIIPSPIGELTLHATDKALTAIRFGRHASASTTSDTPLLHLAARELVEYFAGTRREFTVPLAPAGTPFQQAVWEALRTIPYGDTRSYKQIAEQVKRPRACRAIGMANNRNPLPIIVPCHRVVGHDGSLTGYAGGIESKSLLLELERQ